MSAQLRLEAPGLVRLPRPGRVLDAARARVRDPGLDRATAASVLANYGLEPTAGVENLRSGRNRGVVVPTAVGRKVVKRYADRWDSAAIEHEHSVVRFLEAVGFPAVRLETTPSGATIMEHGGARFAVFDHVDGVDLSGYVLGPRRRSRLWTDAGRLLARFHGRAQGFVPDGRHHLGFRGASGERWRDLDWHVETLERLVAESGATQHPDARWLRARAGRIADRIVELETTLADAPLTTSLIHGDFGLHNILVRRDGTPVLLDFELARIEWPIVDVVAVLSRTDPRDGRTFLAAYDAAIERPSDDRRLLEIVWEHYRLCGAVQSWWTYARAGDERRLATARARVREAERIASAPAWDTRG